MTKELYHVKNIKWDTDGVHPETMMLPLECVIEADSQEFADDPQLLADCLSDYYGWCIESLDASPVPDEIPDAEMKRLCTLPQLNA